jgi:8-oxo-dGTP pyrophosphatase MutT (NUDIX family)
MNSNNQTSAGLILTDSKINTIVVQQYGKSWSFPKGRIEDGEGPHETASREFREETGFVNPMPDGRKVGKNDIYFCGGETTCIRPTFTGNGWNGPDKETTYFLGSYSGDSLLDIVLSESDRDDSITDVKVVSYDELVAMTVFKYIHPEDAISLDTLVQSYLDYYKGNRKHYFKPHKHFYDPEDLLLVHHNGGWDINL